MNIKLRLFFCNILCIFTIHLSAQTESNSTDSISELKTLTKKEIRKQQTKNRNLRYNILGGPGYTPDYGFLVGGSALMTFRTNPSDTTLLRSVLPFGIAVMSKGGINLSTRPQLFFKNDRFRIFGVLSFKNTADNFYGIGYKENKNYERGKETSEFRYSGLQINPWFLFRLGESRFFLGPQIDLNLDKMKKPSEGVIQNPSYQRAGGDAHGYKNFSSGLGFIMTYDSRDVPSNAYGGIYLDAKGVLYNKFIGSDKNFYKLALEYRQYKSVGTRKTFAWTAHSKNVFGKVPLNDYILTGTPFDLRGYYMGQYRDKSSHVAIAEYRQMFNTDKSTFIKKVLHRMGFATWAGCGFMGPNPTKIEGVFPNFGAGLRVEVQPRMNVRLDIGRNTVNKQTLFYFNMTEAF